MDIKKLDTLLQSKLQRFESTVREEELDGIFNAMDLPKQSNKVIFKKAWMLLLFLVLAISALFFALPEKQLQDLGMNSSNTSPNTESIHSANNSNAEESKSNNLIDKNANAKLYSNLPSKQHKHISVFQDLEPIGYNYNNNSISEADEMESKHLLRSGFVSYPKVEFYDEKLALSKQFQTSLLSKKSKDLLTLLSPEFSCWIAPSRNFSSLQTENIQKVHKDFESIHASSRNGLWTLNTGANVSIALLPFMRIGSGISIFSTGSAFNANYKINNIPIIDSATGIIKAYIHKPDSLSQSIQTKNSYRVTYFEIPIAFRIHIFTIKTLRFGIEPIYTHQFYLGSKGKYIDAATLSLRDGNIYKRRMGSAQIGLRIEKSINKKSSIVFCPYFGEIRGNAMASNNQTIKQSYAGLRIGWTYKLY